MSAIKHYHHHYHFSYTTSLKRHFSSFIVVVLLLLVFLFLAFNFIAPTQPLLNIDQLSFSNLLLATFNSVYRLFVAYMIALVLSVPLALLITFSQKLERVLLPFFDILQSIPVLAFFPILVLVFIRFNSFQGAAIFVLSMAMLWNLVFSIIGGLKTIPQDIEAAAIIFKATGYKKLFYITLPSIFSYIVTGSLLAWAQGWNILIVAEVLHTYIPNSSTKQDLLGLGSLLVNAGYYSKNSVFLAALISMIIVIALMNFFIWQKLLALAERYKFD